MWPDCSVRRILPTIIRNGKLFNLGAQRYFLPSELLGAMGVPHQGLGGGFSADLSVVFGTIRLCFSKLDDSVAMAHVGNSMCAAQVGAMLAVVLLSIEPKLK